MMEEKVIIKSEQGNIKLVTGVILAIGAVAGIISIFNMFGNSFYAEKGIGYLLTSAIPYHLAISFLPFAVVAIIFYLMASKVSLTVTDKRVYGTAAFGKRVDLPFDMISAVGTSLFKGIAVTTTSGAIKFLMIKNSDEIHSAISKLLLERQDKPTNKQTVVKQEIPQSNAEELKKYKELLDSGVITQEEFDAKKKQLLEL